MSHSVEKHLAVAPAAYDVEIRRFVPDYEEMLREVEGALAEHLDPGGRTHVVDLGAGTGALSAALAARFPTMRLTLVDLDAAMLARAASRLAGVRDRVTLHEGSFADPLPSCDAAVASLALHHVHDRDDKQLAYANVRAALAPGGILVTADAFVPACEAFKVPLMRGWAAHLVSGGDTEAQAYARFAEWAHEDRYYGIDEELGMLRGAGFREVDVRWRRGSNAVLVARRSTA